MERIFGAGAFERKVPGSKPGKEASVRYVSFDDPASIPKLFYEVLNKMEPKLVNSGGAVLEGTRLELPDGKVRAAGSSRLQAEAARRTIAYAGWAETSLSRA